ncbi:hypothetical protein Raf01_86250 [Rugosimonospora africana]|uniref:Tyr recombinase domain-containing protein n=1 Tax=Rugosimonospora africana TaxID=556532 RepID=A0A8J3R2G9_9ACTN|nr:hypothetical protein Raf01_86250 [Rugosimonospora africana]
MTGVRRGELLGLKWEKIDLEGRALAVHWQRTTTSRNGVIEKAPKGKSKRTVPLGSVANTVLRAHRERQDAEKTAAAEIYEDGDYVFCREDGLLRSTRGRSCRRSDDRRQIRPLVRGNRIRNEAGRRIVDGLPVASAVSGDLCLVSVIGVRGSSGSVV